MNNNLLVLFDIDRTLITSSSASEKMFSEAFRQIYGVETGIDVINYHGMTDQLIILEVLKKSGLTEEEIKLKINDCMNVMVKTFQKLIQESDFKVLAGVKELLAELSKRDVLMGLVTGSLEQIAREKMKWLGLNDYFKVGGFGSDDTNRTKLVKLAIERAKERFNFQPDENIFLFGDAPQDIRAAKEASIKAIGVTTGVYSQEDLLKCNPDYILKDLTDTKRILSIIFQEVVR